MICRNCGAHVADNVCECEYCGTVLKVNTPGISYRGTEREDSVMRLLSTDERSTLLEFLSRGKNAEAQRFLINNLGIDGQLSCDILNQMKQKGDALILNLGGLLNNMTPKTRSVLLFGKTLNEAEKARQGARKYLNKLGYKEEQIILLYDNAVFKPGESGFVITVNGIYSSGSWLSEPAFYLPLGDINSFRIEERDMLINGKKIDICQVSIDDTLLTCAIVARIVHLRR